MEISQELAGHEKLCSTTQREDLFAAVERVLDSNGLSWEKLVGIIKDGAPAMVGKKAGHATLVSQKVSLFGGKVAQYQLWAKSVALGDVVRHKLHMLKSVLTPPVQSPPRGG